MGVSILKCVAIVVSFFATLRGASADEGHIWNVAVGHDWGAYEYIDARGYLAGFTIDMITAVCNAANMNCNLIWDQYNNCIDSQAGQHMRGGKGLLGGWYDACSLWSKTAARIQIFMFSDPMMPQDLASFFVLKTYGSASMSDLQNNKIVGFLDGWADDEKCVKRVHNVALPANKIKHVPNPTDLIAALQNGDVQYIFADLTSMQGYLDSNTIQLTSIPSKACSISGNSMMSRKDNLFNEHFNEGLNKILANGVYKKVCDQAQATHGTQNRGEIKCMDL